MRLSSILTTAIAVLLAACLSPMTSQSAAEPMANDDLAASSKGKPQMPELIEVEVRFNQRDFEGALKAAQAAVKKDPDLPPPQIIMVHLFAQINNLAAVRNALERAVIDAPDDPEAYILIGNMALRDRRFTEAKLVLEKADNVMGSWPGSAKRTERLLPMIHSGLAAVAEAREDWVGAKKQLEIWLRLDPKNASALRQLGQCLFQQKDPQGALEKFKQAAKIDPDMLTPEAILAQLQQRAGDQQNATKSIIAALTANPRDLKTRLAACQLMLEAGRWDEAKNQAAAALQLDPKSLDAKVFRGVVALFQKDYKAAELYFESAHLQSPDKFAPSNNLALALIEQKDESKARRALAYAEANVRQNQKSPEAFSTYGWVLYKVNRLDEAESILRAALSGGSANPDTLYFLANVLVDRKNEAEGQRCLENALKTKEPFLYRDEAKALLEKLKAKATKK